MLTNRSEFASIIGNISPGSVYAYIDRSLGPWEQRPVFKTNVNRFVSLRKVNPPIDIEFGTTNPTLSSFCKSEKTAVFLALEKGFIALNFVLLLF